MKIDRAAAVAFLVALGFNKAGEWDNLKLQERLEQVPEKVKEDEVGDEHEELYNKLVKADQDEEQIEVEGDEPGEGKEEEKSNGKKGKGKEAKEDEGEEGPEEEEEEEDDEEEEEEDKKVSKKKDNKKPAKKPEPKKGSSKSEKVDIDSLDLAGLRSLAEEMGLKPKGAEAKTENLLRALIRKAMKSKGSKVADAPAKGKDKPKSKKRDEDEEEEEEEEDEGKEKDAFGCDPDSIRGKVNSALTDEWQTDDEIAEAAGVTVKQARGRLRRMVRKELAEVDRRISYRLPEEKKGKK